MERCIRLLRKGGRLAVVLPEGVLNTSNLQKARDYFEGRAKLVLITSIPQDVFIASGATVTTSLVFLKRFTDEEEKLWKKINLNANAEVNDKYKNEVASIKEKLGFRGKESLNSEVKKALKTQLKEIEYLIENEIKTLVKERFNYLVPVAEITKAGIDSKGARIDNELPKLKEEFTNYRIKTELWETMQATKYDYKINNNNVVRIRKNENGNEIEEIFYE